MNDMQHCSKECIEHLNRLRDRIRKIEIAKARRQAIARERMQAVREKIAKSNNNEHLVIYKEFTTGGDEHHGSELRLWNSNPKPKVKTRYIISRRC